MGEPFSQPPRSQPHEGGATYPMTDKTRTTEELIVEGYLTLNRKRFLLDVAQGTGLEPEQVREACERLLNQTE